MRHLKIVLMGAGGVGKTSLTTQFVREIFEHRYEPTIEEVHRKTIDLDGEMCSLELMDTAGIEQFAQMRDVYIDEGQGFILVYSIVDKTTFNDVQLIYEEITRTKNSDMVPIVLVGNKRDLADDARDVTVSDGQNLANRWSHCEFMEASAISRDDAEVVFINAARQIKKVEGLIKAKLSKSSARKSKRSQKSTPHCTLL